MDEGLLSLRWNDHGLSIFNMLSNIRKNESFCDVTLTCDGFFYPVHKFVLSTCSDFFYQIFEKTPCKHPVIIIANVNRKDLEALLNYMYLGEVSVFRTELKSLVKAAEILKIKGLAEQTENSPVKEKRSSSSETDQPESKRTKSEDYFSVYIKQKESERSHVKNSNSKSKILDSNALNDQDRKDSEVTIDDSLDSVGEFVSAEVSESRRTESSSESNQDPPEVKVEDIFVKEELSDSWYEDAEAGMEDYQYGNPETGLSYDTPQTTFHDNGASWELATAQAQATEGGLPSRVPGPSRLQGMTAGKGKEPRAAAHTANLTARERAVQYPLQCYEDNGKLFCSACEKVLDHTRKSTIESHFRSMRHQNASKRRKQLESTQRYPI
ncbi:protein abrupt-like isoform X5 [Penaeus japonicus]|uniref:protein abrupt-like isoform X5 n=1 Tax=Penaeus japonicus TaxID=27405 RepID=UPI001C7104A5|nr:protein abrupt-like isoform X5 [Penaeus japonicus]XP_042889701.1 protein abrupt-like isoform X5 [Penaeus japonicus]XP_042889702.1 protein abrupt-like isoform X5 [Penaeus japonicus]XP_042889703.1 protein abrupt-like isoform X5 [Penaeus japonicus]